ncbi:acyl-CoA dehydrogenase family protein [Rhodococcus sp. NPDC057014]|uniref:acyl-CoA dehydrogenase family protein n=1 Tax=Rhodococcus sp. NPDC057014 TaxID=3346000 RepID=UPI00364298C3
MTSDFRIHIREWLREHGPHAPPDPHALPAGADLEPAKAWQLACYEAGLVGTNWPKAYGGHGLGEAERRIVLEESAPYNLGEGTFTVAVGMAGPTILDIGTEAQKLRYIRPLLRGDELWCQLYSEPAAGSDVAGIRTSARQMPDGSWRINGQKVWTSGAQHADVGVIITRTDPSVPKHRGLTKFIIDMRQPGIEVRPLRVASGETPFNEVFFDDAVVEEDAVLGEVNGGWAAVVAMLRHERMAIAELGLPQNRLLSPANLAQEARRRGRGDDPRVVAEIVDLFVREKALTAVLLRLDAELEAGIDSGPVDSIAKIAANQLNERAGELAIELMGPEVLTPTTPGVTDLFRVHLDSIGHAIGGGTSQVQKNIIAERRHRLPKDPSPDRRTPFNELPSSPKAAP